MEQTGTTIPGEAAPLLEALARAARLPGFPLDRECYRQWGREPTAPIPFAGTLAAQVCVLGRDLGRDEVRHAQPLVGLSGRRVREGILRAFGEPPREDDPLRERALRHVLLANTVPFKPPENRAYPPAVRERFRPAMEALLARHWRGRWLIPLGVEALEWVRPYVEAADLALLEDDTRFQACVRARLPLHDAANGTREIRILPLPHPSPLNARWSSRFPELLARRLEECRG